MGQTAPQALSVRRFDKKCAAGAKMFGIFLDFLDDFLDFLQISVFGLFEMVLDFLKLIFGLFENEKNDFG